MFLVASCSGGTFNVTYCVNLFICSLWSTYPFMLKIFYLYSYSIILSTSLYNVPWSDTSSESTPSQSKESSVEPHSETSSSELSNEAAELSNESGAATPKSDFCKHAKGSIKDSNIMKHLKFEEDLTTCVSCNKETALVSWMFCVMDWAVSLNIYIYIFF